MFPLLPWTLYLLHSLDYFLPLPQTRSTMRDSYLMCSSHLESKKWGYSLVLPWQRSKDGGDIKRGIISSRDLKWKTLIIPHALKGKTATTHHLLEKYSIRWDVNYSCINYSCKTLILEYKQIGKYWIRWRQFPIKWRASKTKFYLRVPLYDENKPTKSEVTW